MFGFQTFVLVGLFSSVVASNKDVKTGGEFEYTYFPMKSSTINFEVKTKFDATIMISESSNPNLDNDPFLEVVVGGGRNSESVIRRRRFKKGTYEVVLVTPSIVSDQEFRSFWIKFIGDTVLFGRGSDTMPLMIWTDPKPFKRNFFGVSSCCGATAEWKVNLDAVDYKETPCVPLAVKSMDLPLRKNQTNATAILVDKDCFDVLLQQCGVQGGSKGIGSHKANGNKRYVIDEQLVRMHCNTLIRNKMSWDEAKAVCEGRGQKLASVRSKEEQRKLEETIQNFINPFSGVWLAANDRGHAGKFVWYDGTNDVMSYNNWENNARSADSSGGKHCLFASYVSLVVKQQAYWYVQQCTDTWNFVCETYD